MRRPVGSMAALLVSAAIGLAAQGKTEFTGRWTTDPDPSLAAPAGGARGAGAPRGGGPGRAGDMGSGWGSTITISQDSRQLTVEFAFFTRGDMQPPLTFVYALDGSEARNTVMMGQGMQTQKSRTAWDGDALVITTTHTFTDPASGKPVAADVVQRLWLDSLTSLVVETTRAGVLGGPPSTTRTVYRRI